MKCSLTWKAEALEDGRLDGADGAAFAQHVKSCADCRAEQEALAALRARLRALPDVELAPLERARRRGRLLARANEELYVAAPRRRYWAALALVPAALAITMFVRHEGHEPKPAAISVDLSAAAPRYDVTAAEHTMWRARDEGSVARVDLADGEAAFHVEPGSQSQRFLLSLPDGEAEASGGRFSVAVAVGRTHSLNVSEGQVVFRRRDERDLTLNAGESWSRTPPALTPPEEPRAVRTPPAHARAAPAPAPTASTTPPARLATSTFDEAIGSFVRGSYGEADEQLSAFITDHPRDARCEDAAFLRAVACLRMGDRTRARTNAERYLASYPAGLRRAEAQRIVDSSR